jgi:hypothetical protein
MFFHDPLVVRGDIRHSREEKRYYARANRQGRTAVLRFTIRKTLIRIISVRDLNQREREIYERHQNTNQRENYSWISLGTGRAAILVDARLHGADRLEIRRAMPFPNLKPSLRLPVSMIEDLKILANKRDVPCQSLLKVFLAKRLDRERCWTWLEIRVWRLRRWRKHLLKHLVPHGFREIRIAVG